MTSTSLEALEKNKSHIGNLHYQILAALKHGAMTDEELQAACDMNPNTERPRRIELVQIGKVRNSGRFGKTNSGCKAILWELAA